MTAFIKPAPDHWVPADFDLAGVTPGEPVRHISKTVCLLESRCDDYAEYLRAIFRDREPAWNDAIDRRNAEECQHGEVLRLLSEGADPAFDFEARMAEYESLVSYHEPTGRSVRGSVGAELVSRCVVEALASTLYRVLADATADPACRAVYAALAQDEARHFGMFLLMLEAETKSKGRLGFVARCRHAARRMLDLEDDQIMVASCVVAGRAGVPIRRRAEANGYLGRLYPLYRRQHLRYAARMLFRTLGMRPSRALVAAGGLALWAAIRVRGLWARLTRQPREPRAVAASPAPTA